MWPSVAAVASQKFSLLEYSTVLFLSRSIHLQPSGYDIAYKIVRACEQGLSDQIGWLVGKKEPALMSGSFVFVLLFVSVFVFVFVFVFAGRGCE